MSWSFRDLNLTGVEVQTGGSLKPGRYVCRVSDPKIKETRNGGRQVEVRLTDINGSGSVRDFISVYVPGNTENAQTAQRIGRERLKSLLVFGGHPNPDEPGDIKTLDGLIVGVNVEQSEDYEKDGVMRKPGQARRRVLRSGRAWLQARGRAVLLV